MTRRVTNKLLQLMEEGSLDPEVVLKACLEYMSEDQVADMAASEGYIDEDEVDVEEEEEINFDPPDTNGDDDIDDEDVL